MKQTPNTIKPVRAIMMTDRRYPRPVVSIKNALWACGHHTGHLRGPESVRQFLGTLPKPQLERVLAEISN